MLVVMQAQATEEQVRAVCQKIEALGYRPHSMPGAQRTAIGITGNKGEVEAGSLEEMPGVQEVIRVSKPYKLVSRDTKPDNTIVKFAAANANTQPVTIGGRDLAIIAGPCGIETRDQAFTIAERVARAGAQFFRGGAYKPRTSPYSFQGLGEEGLKIMAEIRDRFGLLIVTEAVDYESLDLVDQYADMIQIGARNMQNYPLLAEIGRSGRPALLKRGLSAPLDELLMAAEYILKEGNPSVMLCERGIRTFETDHRRVTLDLMAVPILKELSHLPVIVDPSHAAGRRDLVLPLSLAAAAVGADGIIVEVHPNPDEAICDGPQALKAEDFAEYAQMVERAAALAGKALSAV
jgi:3-deoxy-7-phosphoheptulonate synthase